MMSRFCRYVEKVFDFGRWLGQIRDSRPKPRIPTGTIWASVFFMFATKRRSLNAMESQLRVPKRLERLVGPKKPSADRMGDVFCQIDPAGIRAMLSAIHHKLGRNKALGDPWAMRFAALDGHEFFSQPTSPL